MTTFFFTFFKLELDIVRIQKEYEKSIEKVTKVFFVMDDSWLKIFQAKNKYHGSVKDLENLDKDSRVCVSL